MIETIKRLLEHYQKIGYKEAEEEILRKFPELKEQKQEKPKKAKK